MHISALDGQGDLHSLVSTTVVDYMSSYHYYHQQSFFLLQKHYPFQKIQGLEVHTLL